MTSSSPVTQNNTTNSRAAVISWDRDATYPLNLNLEHLSSAEILLNWLTLPHNFDKYRGDSGPKKSKADVLKEIVVYFKDNGVNYRKSKNIRSRIDRMVNSYREASEWLTRYENGTAEPSFYKKQADKTDAQKNAEVKERLLKMCREYDRIHPFLKDVTWPPIVAKGKERKVEEPEEEDSDEDSFQEAAMTGQYRPISLDRIPSIHDNTHGQLPSTIFTPIRKRITPVEDDISMVSPTKRMKDDAMENDIKRAKLEYADLQRESVVADITIKKNKAALETLKFMYDEGLISKEEYKTKCTSIVESYYNSK